MTLQSFPRGGKKVGDKPSEFSLLNPGKPKNRDRKREEHVEKEETNLVAVTADRLSMSTLCEGLVVLGCVQAATDCELIISLPGGMMGQVPVTEISETYTNVLQSIIKSEDGTPNDFKTLAELYQPGDYVACMTKSIQGTEKRNITLSINAKLVNQNIATGHLVTGLRIACMITSVEDHGCVVDTGIPNVRAFVPSKGLDNKTQMYPGKQIFACIKDIKQTDNAYTLQLYATQKYVKGVCSIQINALDALTPGTKLSLIVKKVLSNGLRVQFGGEHTGYVNRLHLTESLANYSSGMEVTGMLLYIIPTFKYGYFSLLFDKPKEPSLKVGDIIHKAVYLYREANGLIMKLNEEQDRAFIGLRRTDIDFEKINSLKSGSTHKCRVLAYNRMERVYICTMQKALLEQRYFSLSDLKIGDVATVTIKSINTDSNFINVYVEKLMGFVAPEHISDTGLSALKKLKPGMTVSARVLGVDTERQRIRFSLKESIITSKLPMLNDVSEAEVGKKYHGTVVHISKNGVLVRFFGDAKGFMPCSVLDRRAASVKWNYSVGQTIQVKVDKVDLSVNKILLTTPDHKDKKQAQEEKLPVFQTQEEVAYDIGELVEGTITDSAIDGVHVRISKDDGSHVATAFLPAGHMSPCMETAGLLAARSVPGDTISGLIFSVSPILTLTRTFLSQEEFRDFEELKVGTCLPCSIKDITSDGVRMILPVKNYSKLAYVRYNQVSNYSLLKENQMVFAKITSISYREKELGLSLLLTKMFEDVDDPKAKMMPAVDVLRLYFSKIAELSKGSYYAKLPMSKVCLGQRVSGVVSKKTNGGLVVGLENDIQGIVRKHNYIGSFNVGDTVSGTILWINYADEYAELTLLPVVMNSIHNRQSKIPDLPIGDLLRGEIVMVTSWFILIVVKGHGKGCLAAMPARRHTNDLKPDLKPYNVGSKIRCYAVLNKSETDLLPICVLKSAFEMSRVSVKDSNETKKKRKGEAADKEEVAAKKSKKTKVEEVQEEPAKKSKKTKVEEVQEEPAKKCKKTKVEEVQEPAEEESKCEGVKEKKKLKKKQAKEINVPEQEAKTEPVKEKKKRKKSKEAKELENESNNTNDDSSNEITNCKDDKEQSRIPECGFFWDTTPENNKPVESSSESEDESATQPKQKKKKLNATERRELERQKEREIREREEALASNQLPNSVDQFDRLVLASPDSSLIWLQYMAYHLQATEIDKARAVARRAIKSISFREENEKLNVWNAWLNLESKFGTPETLNDVFQEAVRTNDALKVYTHMLTVFVDSSRQQELEKIVSTMLGKFKQDPQVWIECGTAFLKMGLKEKSRHVMQRALQSLPAAEHVNLLVRFANLENKLGDKERSQTLFEQILSSYPKRVDVWSSYVDSLVKSGDPDLARRVLERAVVQTLQPRKMKTLFKKFIGFEEQYGDADAVRRVQEMAAEYVEKQCNKLSD